MTTSPCVSITQQLLPYNRILPSACASFSRIKDDREEHKGLALEVELLTNNKCRWVLQPSIVCGRDIIQLYAPQQ